MPERQRWGMVRAMLLPRLLSIALAVLPAPLLAGTAAQMTVPVAVAPFAGAPSEVAPTVNAVARSPRPVARRVMVVPEARWGDSGERRRWSLTVLSALRGHASRLPEITPEDISTWCPSYASGTRASREAFWLGLVSSLTKHESTWRPRVVGGGGLWFGLMQILPSTARLYDCEARTGAALKDPHKNLSCGLRIMAKTVARDRVVSRNMRGVAADWGPFHSSVKREDMIAWTRSQPYCKGLPRSLRPVSRPEEIDVPQLMAEGVSDRPKMRSLTPRPASPATDEVIATSGHADPSDYDRTHPAYSAR
ncbi:lytic transglycosylase domain-containing protein [Salipiger mucosus]|uniref:Transglycosylase SLT domain-containing protein n=1 Tax=Salipiger mucosus DSM 16094 TaxID=1123237 RepID=S9QQQ7_9RHOB|nr:lytic transglycosylase domain-containing protein [Salipiger mucosus]EPX81987.1 hypothetical protein Salmuc_02351 [Salipiger mucosus DSM 16094]